MTADLALVAMTIVALASMARDYRLQMRLADRMRVVAPPKEPKTSGEGRLSVLGGESTREAA